jgi:hypothetical protein
MSRQFVDMTRIRIEGLLAAFPKLIGSDTKQHTYIETESVRYIYQPIDNLFLLLVTNRASNIVEDLETLRLLSKVVPDVAEVSTNISEDRIEEKCFELIFAFDEVITTGGYKEAITLQQIRSNLEMESHEERLHNMIKQSKVESARDQARAAASTIRENRRDSGMVGIGGGDGPSSAGFNGRMNDSVIESNINYGHDQMSSSSSGISHTTSSSSSRVVAPVAKGMSLMTSGGKNKSLEDALYKEDKLAPIVSNSTSMIQSSTIASQPLIQHPVMLLLSERISCRMTRDGTVESFNIKGSLTLTASDESAAKCCVQLSGSKSNLFTYTTRPEINKGVYESSNLLTLKDLSKGFPSGRPTGILKWTHSSSNEDLIPIKINCWPEEETRGQMTVSIEYSVEQNIELHDVRIRIPLGTADAPNIHNVDGSYKHLSRDGELLWEVALIDSKNPNGSLEFSISQKDSDAFFPIMVDFSSPQLFSNLEISGVKKSTEDVSIQYGIIKSLNADEYLIV